MLKLNKGKAFANAKAKKQIKTNILNLVYFIDV